MFLVSLQWGLKWEASHGGTRVLLFFFFFLFAVNRVLRNSENTVNGVLCTPVAAKTKYSGYASCGTRICMQPNKVYSGYTKIKSPSRISGTDGREGERQSVP